MNDRVRKTKAEIEQGQDYEMQQLNARPHIATSKGDYLKGVLV